MEILEKDPPFQTRGSESAIAEKLKLIKTPHRKNNSRTLIALIHCDRLILNDITEWEISVNEEQNYKKMENNGTEIVEIFNGFRV